MIKKAIEKGLNVCIGDEDVFEDDVGHSDHSSNDDDDSSEESRNSRTPEGCSEYDVD